MELEQEVQKLKEENQDLRKKQVCVCVCPLISLRKNMFLLSIHASSLGIAFLTAGRNHRNAEKSGTCSALLRSVS